MASKTNGHSEREQRELLCELTENEAKERAHQMAEAELKIGELKATRRGLNGEIADLSTTREKLANAIDSGEEKRMVDCAWIEDTDHNVFNLVRQDTGAHVDTRPMSAADHQLGLELTDEEPAVARVDPDSGEVLGAASAVKTRGKKAKAKVKSKANGKKKNTRHAHA